jgi:Rrf2 family protein
MKLSNKGLYGVQAIFDLAFHAEGGSAQIKDICDRQAIPPRFLEQVFQDLRKAGIVTSKRGPRGGYQLASPPERIRVGDIIRALEGPVQLLAASPRSHAAQAAAPAEATTSFQVARDVFRGLSAGIESCLDAVTVAEMCDRADALGLARRRAPAHVYAI